MSLLLGIDLGTSAVKVAAFAADTLRPVASAARAYPLLQPQPGWAEQDPEVWWQAAQAAVEEVVQVATGPCAAIGVTGQMHGLVCLDRMGRPIRPAIVWADTRSMREADTLLAHWQTDPAGMPGPPATGFAVASALWLKGHEPQVLERTAIWVAPKDYIVYRLTGWLGTEPSDASASGLYAVTQRAWSQALSGVCGLTPDQMPRVSESVAVVGHLAGAPAERLGLPPGVPVVAGCADLTAQALGHGVVDRGALMLVVGTGGQVMSPRAAPDPDPAGRFYVFAHCLPERWYAQAAILAGGAALSWLADTLGGEPAEGLLAAAQTVPAGAEGLLFLPYLMGERSPHRDPLASGAFVGLRLHHTRAHWARAVVEGIAFALKSCVATVIAEPAPPRPAIVSGGLARSAGWCQLLADVLELPLQARLAGGDAGCLGAALLAGQGAGLWDFGDVRAHLDASGPVFEPRPSSVYRERYGQYCGLYPLLKAEMHRLAMGSDRAGRADTCA